MLILLYYTFSFLFIMNYNISQNKKIIYTSIPCIFFFPDFEWFSFANRFIFALLLWKELNWWIKVTLLFLYENCIKMLETTLWFLSVCLCYCTQCFVNSTSQKIHFILFRRKFHVYLLGNSYVYILHIWYCM